LIFPRGGAVARERCDGPQGLETMIAVLTRRLTLLL